MEPIEIYPASVLSYIYGQLGTSEKFGFTGRPSKEIGVLSTCTIYQLHNRTIVFTPQTIGTGASYWAHDVNLLCDIFRQHVSYLSQNWNLLGRPTMVLTITEDYFDEHGALHHALAGMYRKLVSGYTAGSRVILGKLSDFLTTSCIYKLQFRSSVYGDPNLDVEVLMRQATKEMACMRPLMPSVKSKTPKRRLSRDALNRSGLGRKSLIQKTRSIVVDSSGSGKVDIRSRSSKLQVGEAQRFP